MTLINDTKESDIMQRLKDLEEYVLRIESSRSNIAVRLERAEKIIKALQAI